MFKTWEDLTEVEQLQSEYSDFYKEVNGVRPRFMSDEQWNSAEWLNAQLKELAVMNEIKMTEDDRREQQAIAEFEVKVDAIIACGAKDRESAIRWILDANDAVNDPDYACYQLNLPYGYLGK